MEQDIAVFEARLCSRFDDVPVPESLAPENIGALTGKRKKNPSVYIVRRVSAMAAALLVCALGAMTLLLHTGAVGGAAETDAAYNESAAMDTAMFDGYAGGTDSEPGEAHGTASVTQADGAVNDAAARTDAEEKEETDEAFEALVEAEKQRLEAARAKGEAE